MYIPQNNLNTYYQIFIVFIVYTLHDTSLFDFYSGIPIRLCIQKAGIKDFDEYMITILLSF